MSSDRSASLSYHEPSIETILVLSSFIILLNVLNWVFDKWLFCGLVGQILVGVAWGTPGGQLLAADTEKAIVELGYIGLILLVFEGGLSTNVASLRANLVLSASVALTGISAPIALSFILAPLTGATHIQCFAAGAALCSTSLGTTFTVLQSCDLSSTRLGVVLTSAAMLDDVVGLVMVQVISNLGSGTLEFSETTVIRPVFVSIAFAVSAVAICRFIFPLSQNILLRPGSSTFKLSRHKGAPLIAHTASLIGAVTAASYAGTSNLFAAYIAGAMISWWQSLELSSPHFPMPTTDVVITERIPGSTTQPRQLSNGHLQEPLQETAVPPPVDVFAHFFHPALLRILQPFFFASVGFSIPITRMFSGHILWKGVVYTILMVFGKLLCGLWLVRVPLPRINPPAILSTTSTRTTPSSITSTKEPCHTVPHRSAPEPEASYIRYQVQINTLQDGVQTEETQINTGEHIRQKKHITEVAGSPQVTPSRVTSPKTTGSPRKPLSLYPASILGLAMVPRGEIGFLISSVGQSGGIFNKTDTAESDIFLIVTWAIVLCTVLGPLCVGILVRRVRRLSSGKGNTSAPMNVLGVWGC